jgi:hypothetical protein
MDSFKHSPIPLGGEKTGNNTTERGWGKRGAKMNLMVDEYRAPISVVLTAPIVMTRSPLST